MKKFGNPETHNRSIRVEQLPTPYTQTKQWDWATIIRSFKRGDCTTHQQLLCIALLWKDKTRPSTATDHARLVQHVLPTSVRNNHGKKKEYHQPPARFLFSIPSLTHIEMLWYILFSSFQIWRSQLRITEKPKKAIDCREAIGDRYAYSISLFFCFVSAWGERRTHKNRVQKEKEEEEKKTCSRKKKKINKTSPLGINVCSKSDTIRPCCRIGWIDTHAGCV